MKKKQIQMFLIGIKASLMSAVIVLGFVFAIAAVSSFRAGGDIFRELNELAGNLIFWIVLPIAFLILFASLFFTEYIHYKNENP